MKIIDQLQTLSSSEVREFVKQNLDNQEFLNQIEAQKEQIVPVLLKHKILPETITKLIIQNSSDVAWLMDLCIESDYTPAYPMVEELSNDVAQEGLLVKVLKAFPSLPITIQLLMKLINQGMEKGALQVLSNRPEFQKPELIILMLKSDMHSEELLTLAKENQVVANKILDDINEGAVENYPKSLISYIICKTDFTTETGPKINYLSVLKIENKLTAQAYQKLIEGFTQSKFQERNEYGSYRSYSYKNSKEYLDWNQELESLDKSLLKDFIISKAPEGSKYRAQWVANSPDEGTNEELIELVRSNPSRSVFKEILTRELSLIKQLNLEKLEAYVSPSDLAEQADKSDLDNQKKLYLYNELSSKYKPALYKLLPTEVVPKNESSRKKSYFFEAFESLKRKDLVTFRESLSHGYDLDQFQIDTHQSSKQRSCELLSLEEEMILQMTQKELLTLIKTPIRFSFYRYSDDDKKESFKYSLDTEDSLSLLTSGKFDVSVAFDVCNNKEQFILSSEIDEENISSLFEHRKEQIFNEPTLLQAYLKKAKTGEALEMSGEVVRQLAKVLTAEELRKIASIDSHHLSDCLNVKGTDGEYVVTKERINEHLQNRYHIEDASFLEALSQRDLEFTKNLVQAYLKGNKDLSTLLGQEIKIKRQALDLFKKLDTELSKSPEAIVEEVFATNPTLSEFKSKLVNYKVALMNFGNGRTVTVDNWNYDDLEDLAEISKVKFLIENLNLTNRYSYHTLEVSKIPVNITIQRLVIGEIQSENLKVVPKIVSEINAQSVSLAEDISALDKLDMALNGLDFISIPDVAQEVLRTEGYVANLKIKHIHVLENYGLLIDDNFVQEVLDHHLTDEEIMVWLKNRLGGLESYIVSEDDLGYSDESAEMVRSLGIKILPDEDFKIYKILTELKATGENFAPIDVSEFSLKIKTKIIDFIEKEIDPNYAKLDLKALNLDTIEILTPYTSMKNSYSLADEDLIKLLVVPSNMQNKKFLKGVRDLVSVAGGGFSYKVDLLKRAVAIINPQVELSLADFIDHSNLNDIKESETMEAISAGVLQKVESEAASIQNNKIFLKNQKKASILRFLRTTSSHGDNYMRDILEMINAVVNGANALEDRVNTLKQEEGDHEATITELSNSIDGIRTRLAEVSLMDDATHMHDRLSPLLSFIKSDPVQPLGQDKYKKFETSKELEDTLGYKLFFPKTRGDLQFLGDTNGWCVNYHKSYGDNVIKNGNILVGICEKGTESTKENVIALAHYLNKGNGNYQLEQLKWSKRKKNGQTNVDATNAFSHGKIISEIKQYLKEYESKKRG